MKRSEAKAVGVLLALATALAAPQAWGRYVIGMDDNNTLSGTAGNDVLSGRGGADQLSGLDGADRIDGGPGDDRLSGGGGPDLIRGSEGADVLRGGAGNDVLDGGPGADTLAGEADTDTASYAYSSEGVTVVLNGAAAVNRGGDAAGDTISSMENLAGSSHADTLTGTSGPNVLDGGPGNDTLKPLGGADRVIGGDGADWVDYTGSEAIYVDLSQGIGTHGDAQGDTYSGVEHVRGGASNDHLVGTAGANTLAGAGGADILEGLGGADALQGGLGTDTADYGQSAEGVEIDLSGRFAIIGGDAAGDTFSSIENLTGSPFDDTLIGNTRANVLNGGAGDDTLEGHGGVDKLIGGEGNDTVSYAASTAGVSVDLTAKVQTRGHAAGDTLSGIENIEGSAHRDDLTGDDGDNVLDGYREADTLTGGAGADTVRYAESTAGVTVDLSRTTAQVSAGDASGDVLSGIEHLVGSDYGDRLTGDGADNVLTGGKGGDTLTGGDGADTASYAGSDAGVTVDLTRTIAQVGTGEARGDLLSGIENLVGSDHVDVLTGDGADNVLTGGAGGDTLTGGTGTDTASYTGSKASVIIDLRRTTKQTSPGDGGGDLLSGIENLIGSAHDDLLTGDANGNRLEGGAGNDTLYGGAGANVFVPGPGTDVVHGGNDIDIVSYEDSDEAVFLRLDVAAGRGLGGDAEGDVLNSIEGAVGTRFDDTIIAPKRWSGDRRPAWISGGPGNDFIQGGQGLEIIEGGPGADHLHGGRYNSDVVTYENSPSAVYIDFNGWTASGGDAEGDTLAVFREIIGSKYDDHLASHSKRMQGLAGADRIEQTRTDGEVEISYERSPAGVTVDLSSTGPQSGGHAQGDRFAGGPTEVYGSAHDDTLSGTSKDDEIVGEGGADTLNGRGGDDILKGGPGNDTLNGGGGYDTLEGGPGGDALNCGAEADIVLYRWSTAGVGVTVDLMAGTFSGGDAQGDTQSDCEHLYGSDYNDTLRGKDTLGNLRGYGGNDVLEGRGGDEEIIGGSGNDRFVFGSAHGEDVIWDFESGRDSIDVSALNVANYAAIRNLITEISHNDQISARIGLTGHGGGTVILYKVRRASLSAADFTF